MKKIWMIILAALMGLGALAGCGSGNDGGGGTQPTQAPAAAAGGDTPAAETVTPAETAPAETAPAEEPESYSFDGVNLEGYTFVVADIDPNRWIPAAGSSDYANAILARNKWVEETLNCKIEYRPHNEEEMKAAVLAGDKYADIAISFMWEIARHGQANSLGDMSRMTNVNFDANYWADFNVVNYLQFGTRKLGTSASFASQTEQIWSCFFNKRLISDLGLDNPYDLVDGNQWTFDKFLEMERAAKMDLDGNGVFDENDRYGFAVGHWWDGSVVMFLASGNPITRVNADGSMAFNIDNDKAYSAMNTVKTILSIGDNFFPKPDAADMDAYVKAFVEGRILFLGYSFGDSAMAPVFQMEDDFGIVPMPMGPEADDYRCWVSHNSPTICVPASNQDLDKTGYVLEALAYKAYPEEENRFDEIALTKLRDDESFETLMNLKKWGVSDFMFMGQQGTSVCYDALNMIVNVGFSNQDTMEVVSEASQIKEAVDIGLGEAVQRFMGTYIEPPSEEEEEEAEAETEIEEG